MSTQPVDKNVLIVVDLQNCFIQGGSLGEQDVEQLTKYHQLVQDIETKIKIKNYDLVVFSKDKHPINHSSLTDEIDTVHGVYPHHCRDIKCNCNENGSTYFSKKARDKVRELFQKYYKDDKVTSTDKQLELLLNEENRLMSKEEFKEIEILANDKTHEKTEDPITIRNLLNKYKHQYNFYTLIKDYVNKENIVKGLDLNYLFYGTELARVIDKLNNGEGEIGFKYNVCSNLTDLEIENEPKFELDIKPIDGKYVTIPKGQRCNYESYSSFNYHIKIKKNKESMTKKLFDKYDSSMNEIEKLPAHKKYSTGLFEYIIKYLKLGQNEENVNLNINVCGLVTNICVINTLQQGIALWNSVYSKERGMEKVTCNFKLLEYMSVPLSLPINTPYLFYPYSDSISSNVNGDEEEQIKNLKRLFDAKFHSDILSVNDDKSVIGGPITKYHVSIHREDKDEDAILLELPKLSGGKKSIRNKAKTKKVAEKKAATKKVAEKKAATKKVAEKKAAEKKAATKKAAEKKAATKKAAEKKAATKKAL